VREPSFPCTPAMRSMAPCSSGAACCRPAAHGRRGPRSPIREREAGRCPVDRRVATSESMLRTAGLPFPMASAPGAAAGSRGQTSSLFSQTSMASDGVRMEPELPHPVDGDVQSNGLAPAAGTRHNSALRSLRLPTISCLPSGVQATPRGPVAGKLQTSRGAPPVAGMTVSGTSWRSSRIRGTRSTDRQETALGTGCSTADLRVPPGARSRDMSACRLVAGSNAV